MQKRSGIYFSVKREPKIAAKKKVQTSFASRAPHKLGDFKFRLRCFVSFVQGSGKALEIFCRY